jgi:molybdate transport system substrate-binding protein
LETERHIRVRVVGLAAALALFLLPIACGGDGAGTTDGAGESPALLVYAASDLQLALSEVAERFETETGIEVTLVFGSTGNLTTQIQNGAPGDVFFAANESFIDQLSEAGMVVEDTRRIYALGRLALLWGGGAARPTALEDLARPEYRTISIANPEHAPYGMAAREAFRSVGIWDVVEERLVLGENVSQALQFLDTGNADAALVALGLVVRRDTTRYLLVPDSLHAPLRQATAVIGTSQRVDDAKRFLSFLGGPEGEPILRRYGFGVPG